MPHHHGTISSAGLNMPSVRREPHPIEHLGVRPLLMRKTHEAVGRGLDLPPG